MPRSTTGDHIEEDLPSTVAWNSDGTINYIEMTNGSKTWRLTFTYSSGQVTATSGWVLQ